MKVLDKLVDKLQEDKHGDLIAGTVVFTSIGYFVLRIVQGVIM